MQERSAESKRGNGEGKWRRLILVVMLMRLLLQRAPKRVLVYSWSLVGAAWIYPEETLHDDISTNAAFVYEDYKAEEKLRM